MHEIGPLFDVENVSNQIYRLCFTQDHKMLGSIGPYKALKAPLFLFGALALGSSLALAFAFALPSAFGAGSGAASVRMLVSI